MGLIGEGIDLLKLVDKARNADLYKQLGEWIDRVGELQKRNSALEAELVELKGRLNFMRAAERISGHTFVEGDDEEVCSRCAEVDRRGVHLISGMVAGHGRWSICPQCKAPGKSSRPATRQSIKATAPTG